MVNSACELLTLGVFELYILHWLQLANPWLPLNLGQNLEYDGGGIFLRPYEKLIDIKELIAIVKKGLFENQFFFSWFLRWNWLIFLRTFWVTSPSRPCMGVESPQLDSKFCPDGGLRFAIGEGNEAQVPLKTSCAHEHCPSSS